MWDLDHKESWVSKNWWFWTVGLEKIHESPLGSKEIKPVNLKGNQSWLFIGKTDAEVETPILWPPYVKSQPIRKHPDAGKDWSQEKGTTEDKMVGFHHWLNGHEFKQALGFGDGQGSPACCGPWRHKKSDTTEWLHWLSMVLPIRTRSRFPHSQSLPSLSFHKCLILIHQRADRMETTVTEN